MRLFCRKSSSHHLVLFSQLVHRKSINPIDKKGKELHFPRKLINFAKKGRDFWFFFSLYLKLWEKYTYIHFLIIRNFFALINFNWRWQLKSLRVQNLVVLTRRKQRERKRGKVGKKRKKLQDFFLVIAFNGAFNKRAKKNKHFFLFKLDKGTKKILRALFLLRDAHT